MRFRKLRIAFSATCLIACILLIVLWVRSYNNRERVELFDILGCSSQGTIWIYRIPIYIDWDVPYQEVATFEVDLDVTAIIPPTQGRIGFYLQLSNWPSWIVGMPHWFAAVLAGILAAAPWLRSRYSLRSLLIAMTLIAVGLGLIVYLSAKPPASPPIDHVDVPEF